jgi:hypothetical protein
MPRLLSLLGVAIACCGIASPHAQESSTLRLVPIGQLDTTQLRRMQAPLCGPYFTITPTDSSGGGLLHLAVTNDDTDVRVVTVPVGAVKRTRCESCQPPRITAMADDESTVRMDVALTEDDWKMSPCLRRNKLAKPTPRPRE